jgi:hypothetical protein
MNGILSQRLFTIAYIYKCYDLYIAQKNIFIIVNY